MNGDSGFQRGGSGTEQSDYDPLFYRGKSPVLGQPVELKTGGELPAEFPATGPGAPPSAPAAGTPPTPPGGGAFPPFSFDFSGLEFPEAPTPPGAPSDLMGPGAPGRTPWWAAAGQLGEQAEGVREQIGKLMPAESAGWPGWSVPGGWNLSGATGIGEPSFSLTGNPNAPALDPANFRLGGPNPSLDLGPYAAEDPAAAQAAQGGGIWPTAGSALQTAGGLYGAVAPGHSPGQRALGAMNAAGGGAALLSNLGILGPGWAAMGPAAALASAPVILGQLYHSLTGGDRARFPEGYQTIPGSAKGEGARAVDPNTGAVLVYKGNGKYAWSDETQAGQMATPQQFTQWGIDPTGELLKQAPYQQAYQGMVRQDIAKAGMPIDTSSGGLSYPTQAHQQTSLQQGRQATIDRLKAAHPGASDAEVWRLYTMTPEYQQEQARQAMWNPQQERGAQ